MNLSRLTLLWIIVGLIAGALFFTQVGHSFQNQNELLKIGSRGSDVTELQQRLTYIGYYHGEIDGQYGWMTYQGVQNFQIQFGLELADGIAGPKTKEKLLAATSDWQGGNRVGTGASLGSAYTLSRNDRQLMAQAVYGEARGEPYEGQVAVAAVILNRLKDSQFPDTVSGVIFEPLAFTAVADGQIWLEPDESAHKAVQDAINGWDPSLNALYYFNPETATSKWIWTRPQIKQIGRHIFCH